MSYCTNCGSQIADNAKYCHKCGATNLNFANQSNSNQRREEYVGKVLKCPACGAEISGINAICPSCGHEINSTSVDPILKNLLMILINVMKLLQMRKKNLRKVGKLGVVVRNSGGLY